MKKIVSFILTMVMILSLSFTAFAEKRVVKENEDVEVITTSVTPEEQKLLEKMPVEIKAKAAVLMDVSSGEILLEYNADKKLYPASVTKVMTMLLVCEAINEKKITLADKVACSENAASKGGSQIWLEVGEEMSVDELLKATAIGSANDAATLLGEYVAGSDSAFIDMMNTRARELGMKNTSFENATGLDDTTQTHLTTAKDIAIMSRELLKYDFIIDYTTVWMESLRNGETELVNTNKLVRFYDGTTGLKTGTTAKAGCCVSASAKRNGLHLVAVVMGSDNSNDRFETAKGMLNWGFSNYVSYTPVLEEKIPSSLPVIGGKIKTVELKIPEMKSMLLKKGTEKDIKISLKTEESLKAPVTENQKVGKITLTLSTGEKLSYNITTVNSVEKLTIFGYALKIFNFISNGKTDYPFK